MRATTWDIIITRRAPRGTIAFRVITYEGQGEQDPIALALDEVPHRSERWRNEVLDVAETVTVRRYHDWEYKP